MGELSNFTIEKFLGVNKSVTETLLELGEASNISNWMITDDQKLSKMFGYTHLNTATDEPVRGQWYGLLSNVPHHVFSRGGHVYERDLSTNVLTDLGEIEDDLTMFFPSNNKLYIIDGKDMYEWDGTTFSTVTGYVPTVFTAAPPTGGGTILEGINYLTGSKIMKFSGDNTATIYQLNETDIDSVDSVTVNGVLQTVNVDYAVDLSAGTVTFVVKPPTGVNNVVIQWTKEVEGDRKEITQNQYYGGMYYARHWIYGNKDRLNARYPSGVTMAGVSDPTYWPKFTDSDVGEYEITGIATQYKQQVIFTSGDSSGASAWFSTSETYTDSSTGIVTILFPVYPINAKIGNQAKGQVQIIVNDAFTLWKGVYRWVSTNVQDEKNAQWISKRIQPDLDEVDLTNAITYDWDDKGVYLVCVGKRVWCFNYRTTGANNEPGTWYILDIPDTPTSFISIEGDLYFGTDKGQIMKFGESYPDYDGTTIEAVWDMGYFSFGAEWIRKYINKIFVSLLPYTETFIDLYVSTDLNATFEFVERISYGLSSFETWDFSDFSFETNYSPQPFPVRLRQKKIAFLKLRIQNDEDNPATVLSITLPTRAGGVVKRM